MFSEEHNQYVLLHRVRRTPVYLDRKTLLIVGCLILAVTVFCATDMILFGIYKNLVYPKNGLNTFVSSENLENSRYRAIAYSNTHPNKNVTEIPKFVHNYQPDHAPNALRLVCYFNFPANDQSMQVSDIDPNLCTHLNLAFASVVNNSLYLDNEQLSFLAEIIKLKQTNENLKVLVSVGGAGNQNGFPEMVKNHTNRKIFIKSVWDYVQQLNIDGVDLDWEFPGAQINYDPNQRMHFTQLLSEMRKSIARQDKYKVFLTVAVAAITDIVDVSYDVAYMNEYVDFVNLMSYDFHYFTSVTPFTGINSPLYETSSEKYFLTTLNINYSSHYWNYLGMDKSKIVIGLPTYGHSFRLVNSNSHDLYAPASGYGKLGNLGFASYPMICNFLQKNHITPVFDMENFSPYAAKYYEWISFDDSQSLTYKAEFIKSHNFGGAMVYCLNADDFKGICNMGVIAGTKFPLISSIKNALDGAT
ncbi:chitinase-3-like protein 2 [Dendroctonus ponderosae]|uniref:GH18 domain-containing protein n=3 Tax=Dendroctonus ponderosae TaxID=77166 RepID=A0AAR5Q8L6_DENPD|nr:chitinase-3-like protein 2 [Dendroctonus ponderosae]XP_048520328.1 chitinase-3-like protein 2 [Dendroctonus ponderosae]XP_048521806.1 chitinase-3-like protein 2 [Dendroctonus ponderosae]KAH1011555.1 hypothetical protein HUJ04_000902 [Dendroctonus ponderosae]KAH1018532.1 hypothetical protein HUJ05_006281 [Dendroctonus ponderosae]KAH1018534.1 hypothetical protein HUJ05_006283 [Dendroctonus ponderosae]